MSETVFLCGRNDIGGGRCCVWCESLLQKGRGIEARGGLFCGEECAAQHHDWLEQMHRADHLRVRDMLCDCDTCAAAGHPTVAERAEWAAYVEQTAVSDV